MIQIPVYKVGEELAGFALVDEEDFPVVGRFRWIAKYERGNPYPYTCIGEHNIMLHRLVFGRVAKGKHIDHINRNPFDNRKENLREVSVGENLRNRPAPKNNTSGYKGVTWFERKKKWYTYIRVYVFDRSVSVHLGGYDTKEEGALAYDCAARIYHKEHAFLNLPNQQTPDEISQRVLAALKRMEEREEERGRS